MAAVYVVCGDFHLGWIAPVAVAVAALAATFCSGAASQYGVLP